MNFHDTTALRTQRRAFLRQSGLALAALGSAGPLQVLAQTSNTLTIAYNVDLPSWDPTVGPSAVNPTGNALTPSFDQQVVQTQITMQDGDTIAIGGVIAENTTSASSGIPGLSRIPILGAAFGSRTYTKSRSELVLFMTPHVIYDTTTDLLEASDELSSRLKSLRKYMKR